MALLLAITILAAGPSGALAGPLDAVPLETRAKLAVAASAYPPAEAPALHPEAPDFSPEAAAGYLETEADDQYGASTVRGGLLVYFTLLRFANVEAAAAGFEHWKTNGDAVQPLDWGGSFPAFRRGKGLLGIGLAGAGVVARGQSGRWHLEVAVSPQDNSGADPVSGAAEAMKLFAANAQLYRIFPRELVVSYEAAGGAARRLAAGEPFQLPLQADAEVAAVLSLQVLDAGQPVKPVEYKLELSGPLSAVAELDQDGSRSRTTLAEASSPDGEPAKVTFVFPPGTSAELSRIIDEEDTTLHLRVEARTAPAALP